MKYQHVFPDVLKRISMTSHDVDVGDTNPIKQHPYRMNPEKCKLADKEIDYMLKHGIIQPSKSEWSSPCLLFCYKKMNNVMLSVQLLTSPRKSDKHQQNYSTIEKELLGIVLALQHFEVYVCSAKMPLVVYTDHNPLVFLNKLKNKNRHLLNWSLMLQEYDLQIKHIRGKDNIVADCLSRC